MKYAAPNITNFTGDAILDIIDKRWKGKVSIIDLDTVKRRIEVCVHTPFDLDNTFNGCCMSINFSHIKAHLMLFNIGIVGGNYINDMGNVIYTELDIIYERACIETTS